MMKKMYGVTFIALMLTSASLFSMGRCAGRPLMTRAKCMDKIAALSRAHVALPKSRRASNLRVVARPQSMVAQKQITPEIRRLVHFGMNGHIMSATAQKLKA